MAFRGEYQSGPSVSASGILSSIAGFLGLEDIQGRARAILLVFLGVALVFFCRLFFIQIITGPSTAHQTALGRTVDEDLVPQRGTIYDRNGIVLATSVKANKIVCDPDLMYRLDDDARKSNGAQERVDFNGIAAQLASILELDKDYVYKLITTRETDEGNIVRYAVLARALDDDEARVVEALGAPGIFVQDDYKRIYPNGSVGAQVIGLTDVDGNGVTGIEAQYDGVLGGEVGHIYYENGADGNYIAGTYKRTDPVDGKDIVISLDVEMQKVAEKKVKEAAKRMSGDSGQVLMLDGKNGEIIAAAGTPFLDPVKRTGDGNLAVITGAFEPGSIFKPVTMLAALETGTVSNKDKLYLPRKLKANEYYVSDAHERPAVTMTVDQIMAQSSNVGLSLIGKRMGFEELYKRIDKYHLNCELTGVDFPSEASGYLTDVNTWSTIQAYNVTFGQGVMVSPLQITRFYGALANDGVLCTPHFLMKVVGEDEAPVKYKKKRITKDTEAIAKLNKMLCGVVKNGTGKKAAIDGYDVAGKTGTAEYVIEGQGTYAQDSYNLSFIGYLPNSDSDLVCYVGITHVPMDSVTTAVYHDIMTYAIDRYNINQKKK